MASMIVDGTEYEPYELIEVILEVANAMIDKGNYSVEQLDVIREFASNLTKKYKEIQLK